MAPITNHEDPPWDGLSAAVWIEDCESGLDAGGEPLDYDSAGSIYEWGVQTEDQIWTSENLSEVEAEDIQDEGEVVDDSPESPSPQCYWCGRTIEQGGFSIASLGIVCGAACRDRPNTPITRLNQLASYQRINSENFRLNPRPGARHPPFDPGVPTLRRGTRWSPDEEAQLLESWRAGTSISELAESHKRTKTAVTRRLCKLGVDELPDSPTNASPTPFEPHQGPRNGEPWTPSEDDYLLASWRSGIPIRDIANAHGRTEGAITSRLPRIGVIEERDGAGTAPKM